MGKLFSNDPAKTVTWSGKFKKQSSWFKTDEDIQFEDSFKFWFALMWQNMFIVLGLIGFTVTALEITHPLWVGDVVAENFQDGGTAGGIFTILGLLVGPAMFSIIAYKGWWQYWDDMKKGKSR